MSCFPQQLLNGFLTDSPQATRKSGASGYCLCLPHPGIIPWFAGCQACGNTAAEISLLALEASLGRAGGIGSFLQHGKAALSALLSVSFASSPWKSCFSSDICNLPRAFLEPARSQTGKDECGGIKPVGLWKLSIMSGGRLGFCADPVI